MIWSHMCSKLKHKNNCAGVRFALALLILKLTHTIILLKFSILHKKWREPSLSHSLRKKPRNKFFFIKKKLHDTSLAFELATTNDGEKNSKYWKSWIRMAKTVNLFLKQSYKEYLPSPSFSWISCNTIQIKTNYYCSPKRGFRNPSVSLYPPSHLNRKHVKTSFRYWHFWTEKSIKKKSITHFSCLFSIFCKEL